MWLPGSSVGGFPFFGELLIALRALLSGVGVTCNDPPLAGELLCAGEGVGKGGHVKENVKNLEIYNYSGSNENGHL